MASLALALAPTRTAWWEAQTGQAVKERTGPAKAPSRLLSAAMRGGRETGWQLASWWPNARQRNRLQPGGTKLRLLVGPLQPSKQAMLGRTAALWKFGPTDEAVWPSRLTAFLGWLAALRRSPIRQWRSREELQRLHWSASSLSRLPPAHLEGPPASQGPEKRRMGVGGPQIGACSGCLRGPTAPSLLG